MGLLDSYFDPETLAAVKQLNQPSEEDRRNARNNALMNAGFAMMLNNGGRSKSEALMNALGSGGMAGVQSYQGQLEDARQRNTNQFTQGIQLTKLIQDQKARQLQMQQREALRNSLPEQDRNLFDVAPDEYIKNMPRFQKPQLVEVADPADPTRMLKQWTRPGETEGTIVGRGTLPDIMNPEVFAKQVELAKAKRPVQTTNVFNNTKDDFKNERDLRNDFAGLPTTKAFNEVQSAYDQIKVALDKQSPAGDLAGATKIMKILDPGSVVRESELGLAMQATGAMDRVSNYADMILKGTKLTPSQRKDFGELATQLYGAASDRYNKSAEEYQGIAKDYNLNAGRVAKKAQPVQQQRSIKRSGMYGGKKVIEYSDGSIEYAN